MVIEYAPDRQSLELEQAIEPLIAAQGFRIVELSARTVKGTFHVHLVLHGPVGTTIDDVAEAHRLVQPVIEELLAESTADGRDLNLEVSTPGIERTIKTTREFSVFRGRGIRLLRQSTQDWIGGVIASADETSVDIERGGGIERIPFDDIVKAKLDHTQEEER